MFPSSNQSGDYLYEIYDIPHHQDFPHHHHQHNLTPGHQDLASDHGSRSSSTSSSHLTLTAPTNTHTHTIMATKPKQQSLKKLATFTGTSSHHIDDEAGANAAAAANEEADIEARKTMRKEIERERRQHMAKLSAKLRSLLPLDSIKGKRAVSDNMNEAVNYIKYLKKRVQELGVKRDKLKRLAYLSNGGLDQGSTNAAAAAASSSVNCVAVHPYCGGVEIVVNGGFGEGSCWHLSSLMQVVVEEGLDVVRCVSSQTNEGFLHTIQSEVSDPTQLDLARLERRLNDLMISFIF